ncbi:MAG: hypothetical protein M1491_09230 [Deltaproteobacteria bacterium]|nr:hypothetical protein [Deltaproteobacteria bacterium]MCL5276788.1 hypothetical protein [Deltaproteobacteria bacterium]
MAAKQGRLLDVLKQFKDGVQEVVQSTQSQVRELVVKTTNDVTKLAVNNPQIKKVVQKLEAEQKKYETVFMDLQDKVLDTYKERVEKAVSDIRGKIEGYRKQAEKLYKDAVSGKRASSKAGTSSKGKSRTRSKRANVAKSGSVSSNVPM